jgi:hypothetical protein
MSPHPFRVEFLEKATQIPNRLWDACFGERLANMYIGMDYSRPKEWMLFFRLWQAAVDLALSRGLSAIVSGRSSYEAKIEIGHKLVPLNNYCSHRDIFLHNIYRISRLRSTGRRWTRPLPAS